MNVSRRNFFKVLAGSVAALALMPERVLAAPVKMLPPDVFHVTGSRTLTFTETAPPPVLVFNAQNAITQWDSLRLPDIEHEYKMAFARAYAERIDDSIRDAFVYGTGMMRLP